jgi:histone acetyltransferase SAS3
MPSAQAMEEELQQSVLLSEEGDCDTGGTGVQVASSRSGSPSRKSNGEGSASDDDELSDQDASGEELDLDASGEEDNDMLSQQIVVGSAAPRDTENEEADDEEDVGEDDEAVGAVKVRPAESDDQMESDVSDAASAEDEEEGEEEGVWEERGDADEEEEEESEESDAGPLHTCIFCKQDEENDPSEDYEAFLVCSRCGDNGKSDCYWQTRMEAVLLTTVLAHQQCARGAVARVAMTEENSAFLGSQEEENGGLLRRVLIDCRCSSLEMSRMRSCRT